MNKVTPFLWFEKEAGEAADFYVSVFKNAKIIDKNPMFATFEIEGQQIMALNGGPQFKLNEAFSLYVACEDQAEVDYFWEKLSEGGAAGQCGWLKDKFGVSWQIIPKAMNRLMGDPDQARAGRVMQAMRKMGKIIVEDLEKA